MSGTGAAAGRAPALRPAALLPAAYAAVLGLPLAVVPIFQPDWINHVWYAGYVARHLASDLAVPMFVNVPAQIGNPALAYYGSGTYAAMAPLVWVLGPDAGLRVAALAALLLPAVVMARLVDRMVADRRAAIGLTVVLTTSIYQLTNLYTRGAATEFFACQLLLLALLLGLSAVAAAPGGDGRVRLAAALAAAGLGVLAHPPTAYLAALFLAAPLAVLACQHRRALAACLRRPALAAGVAAVAAVPVALWAVRVAVTGGDLEYGRRAAAHSYNLMPWSIDHWLARMLPWSMDFRVEAEGFDAVSTPWLGAPVNGVALLLLVWVAGLAARPRAGLGRAGRRAAIGVAAAALAAAGAALWLSLPGGALLPAIGTDGAALLDVLRADPASLRGWLLGPVQFAYRLVNLVNLATALGVLGVLLAARRAGHPPAINATVMIVAATVCAGAAGAKLVEVFKEYRLLPALERQLAGQRPRAASPGGLMQWLAPGNVARILRDARDPGDIPETQYGLWAYAMPAIFPRQGAADGPAPVPLVLRPVDAWRSAGGARCAAPCLLATNLVPSRFFAMAIDGVPVPAAALRIQGDHGALRDHVALAAPAGDHQVAVALGDRSLRVQAHATALLALVFWLLLAWLAALSWRGRRRPADAAVSG